MRDLTDDASSLAGRLGPVTQPWQIGGRTYALPYTFGIVGFWYNTEHFAQAGITREPATLAELYAAIDALKAAGITPIAVGAVDGWPAVHYWSNLALKACAPAVLEAARAHLVFDDPCFVRAGELLGELIASEPFNEGYLATGSGTGQSPADLLATGQVAMELMGWWEPAVMGRALSETGAETATPPQFLDWFPFPAVEGGDGDPSAVLGGGSGFSVAADAPPEAVDLLRYLLSEDVQQRFAATGEGLPALPAAHDSITDPYQRMVVEGISGARYAHLWFDTSYGPVVGSAMNEAVVNFFFGQGTPEGVVEAMRVAARGR